MIDTFGQDLELTWAMFSYPIVQKVEVRRISLQAAYPMIL